ncbi:hypothetical protein [Nocardioides mangrovicus]|nr:hypothetical protein [Nocardioides mangrovicus]
MAGPSTPEVGRYTFPSSQGTVSGIVGIGLVILLVVVIAVDGWGLDGLRVQLALVAFGVLTWALMLRPKILVRGGRLVLRNPFHELSLPLHLVDDVEVRAVTKVHSGARTYVGIAVGRKTRQMVRPTTMGAPLGPFGMRRSEGSPAGDTNADLLEEWVNRAAADARRDAKRLGAGEEEIRRTPFVGLYAALGVLVVAFVVTLFL